MVDLEFATFFAGLSVGLLAFVIAAAAIRSRLRDRAQWKRAHNRVD
jgi:hypothetical protein